MFLSVLTHQKENPNDVMMKEFNVETNMEATQASEFTFEDCDMTRSGPTEREGEYRIRGTQTATSTSHCMAIYSRPLFSRRYRIKAKFRHDEGKVVNGLEYSHMGLLVKYENKENFVYAIVRYSPTVQPIQGILGWGGGGGVADDGDINIATFGKRGETMFPGLPTFGKHR